MGSPQGTPAPLRSWLGRHTVVTAYEKGRDTLSNGDLIQSVETEGFDLLVTTDKNLKYQQKLAGRKIAIIYLSPCISVALAGIQWALACGGEALKSIIRLSAR